MHKRQFSKTAYFTSSPQHIDKRDRKQKKEILTCPHKYTTDDVFVSLEPMPWEDRLRTYCLHSKQIVTDMKIIGLVDF